jgi:hypothetical protein
MKNLMYYPDTVMPIAPDLVLLGPRQLLGCAGIADRGGICGRLLLPDPEQPQQ